MPRSQKQCKIIEIMVRISIFLAKTEFDKFSGYNQYQQFSASPRVIFHAKNKYLICFSESKRLEPRNRVVSARRIVERVKTGGKQGKRWICRAERAPAIPYDTWKQRTPDPPRNQRDFQYGRGEFLFLLKNSQISNF